MAKGNGRKPQPKRSGKHDCSNVEVFIGEPGFWMSVEPSPALIKGLGRIDISTEGVDLTLTLPKADLSRLARMIGHFLNTGVTVTSDERGAHAGSIGNWKPVDLTV